MKILPFAMAWLLTAGVAAAQDPPRTPLTRGDAHFVIGWQNLHKPQSRQQSYSNDWVNGIFYGGAGAGWEWTDNLKTQEDGGGGNRGRQYRYEIPTGNGRDTRLYCK